LAAGFDFCIMSWWAVLEAIVAAKAAGEEAARTHRDRRTTGEPGRGAMHPPVSTTGAD